MRNKHVKSILKSEVESMLPNNEMVAKVKKAQVNAVVPAIKNISEIKEKNKRSIIPMIASCVASVIMPQSPLLEDINDSKKLTEKKREKLFEQIKELAISYHIELVDNKMIDDINILNATKLGMKRCIENLEIVPEMAIIDAVKIDTEIPTDSIIKGDALSYNVAAASILAKVTRDRLMIELDKKYPEYGFAKHKGYGTKLHYEMLKEYGPSPVHRMTFLKKLYGEK